MKKLFVGNLTPNTTEASLTDFFSSVGKVRSVELVKDLFSGNCKGFAFIEMEGHEARRAIAELNGKQFEGKSIKIKFEQKQRGRRH